MPQSSISEAAGTNSSALAIVNIKSATDNMAPTLLPDSWNLTASETVILQTLLKFEVVKKGDLVKSLYGDSPEESSLNTLRVLVHLLRKKTRQIGIEIRNIYGVGYTLTDRDSWVARLDSKQLSQ